MPSFKSSAVSLTHLAPQSENQPLKAVQPTGSPPLAAQTSPASDPTLNALATSSVELPRESINWANQVSSAGHLGDRAAQDKTNCMVDYLQGLATAGFAQWVNSAQLGCEATYNRTHATNICEIGSAQVGIVPVTGIPNQQISLPAAFAQNPHLQFFVLVDVLIDDSAPSVVLATVLTALPCASLQVRPPAFSEADYLIPITQFNRGPEQLLLHLEGLCQPQCEMAKAHGDSAQASNTPAEPSHLETHMPENSQHQAQAQPAEQTEPAADETVGITESNQLNSSPPTHQGNQNKQLTQTNTPNDVQTQTQLSAAPDSNRRRASALKAYWEDPAEGANDQQPRWMPPQAPCNWTALPYVASSEEAQPEGEQPATSTMSPSAAEELPAILNRFDPSDIEVPSGATGVYADLSISEYRLRLYALVWEEASLLEPELSLVLILGPIENSYLPIGTELTIREHNLLNSGQNLRWTSHPSYLYTQVFGDWAEKFTVEILVPNARPVRLPSLGFQLEEES